MTTSRGGVVKLTQLAVVVVLTVACAEMAVHVWGDLSGDHVVLGVGHGLGTVGAWATLFAWEPVSWALLVAAGAGVVTALRHLDGIGRLAARRYRPSSASDPPVPVVLFHPPRPSSRTPGTVRGPPGAPHPLPPVLGGAFRVMPA